MPCQRVHSFQNISPVLEIFVRLTRFHKHHKVTKDAGSPKMNESFFVRRNLFFILSIFWNLFKENPGELVRRCIALSKAIHVPNLVVLREIHHVSKSQQKPENPINWVGLSSRASVMTWAVHSPCTRKGKKFSLMASIVP